MRWDKIFNPMQLISSPAPTNLLRYRIALAVAGYFALLGTQPSKWYGPIFLRGMNALLCRHSDFQTANQGLVLRDREEAGSRVLTKTHRRITVLTVENGLGAYNDPQFDFAKFRHKRTTVKLFNFCNCVVVFLAVALLPLPRAEASSYCPGCTAGIAGAAVGVGVIVGVTIYAVHRSHTSLKGCVVQTSNGYSLSAKDGKSYELTNTPSELKAHRRVSLRGHKTKSASGNSFRVDHFSRDFGECAQ